MDKMRKPSLLSRLLRRYPAQWRAQPHEMAQTKRDTRTVAEQFKERFLAQPHKD